MKDILQDIVAHTHSLGFLSTVKVTGEELATTIEAMAEDRSVIVNAKTHTPVDEFSGVFGNSCFKGNSRIGCNFWRSGNSCVLLVAIKG